MGVSLSMIDQHGSAVWTVVDSGAFSMVLISEGVSSGTVSTSEEVSLGMITSPKLVRAIDDAELDGHSTSVGIRDGHSASIDARDSFPIQC